MEVFYTRIIFRYREALAKECPCLGIGEKEALPAKAADAKTETTATA